MGWGLSDEGAASLGQGVRSRSSPHRRHRSRSHSRHRSHHSLEHLRNRLNTANEWLLIILLAWAPLPFGSVEAWSQEIILALAGLIGLCFALKLVLFPESRPSWSWAYLPIAVVVALAAFQLLPLPAWVVEALSPHTASLKRELLADAPDAPALLRSMTLSFYPNGTCRDLRLVVALGLTFVAAVSLFRRREMLIRYLVVMAIIGGSVSLLALLQDLSGTDEIFWLFPGRMPTARCGPFIHYNHYSQYMNLCIGVSLALLLLLRAQPGCLFPHAQTDAERRPGDEEWGIAESGFGVRHAVAALGFSICVGGITVLLSLSRGGTVSLVVCLLFAAIALAVRGQFRGHGWILAITALAIFAGILFVGFDAVSSRLATLRDATDNFKSRSQILKDLVVVWKWFPTFGIGLGSHEFVYPMFDHSNIVLTASHAENEYAQMLEELGIPGLTMLALFCLIMLRYAARALRSQNTSTRAIAIGLCGGLLAVAVHSFSDFGQHLPANAFLSCTMMAMLVNLGGGNADDDRGQSGRQRHRSQPKEESAERHAVAAATQTPEVAAAGTPPSPEPRAVLRVPARILWLLAVIGGVAWTLVGADRARRAEAAWSDAAPIAEEVETNRWQGTNDEYTTLIRSAQAAAEIAPQDIVYRYKLCLYRWCAMARDRGASGYLQLSDFQFARTRQLVADLQAARPVCPSFGQALSLLGQLEYLVLGTPTAVTPSTSTTAPTQASAILVQPAEAARFRRDGALHARLGARLAPRNPIVRLAAGIVEGDQGNWDQAAAHFEGFLTLNWGFNAVADAYVVRLHAPERALPLAEKSPRFLLTLADVMSRWAAQNPTTVTPAYREMGNSIIVRGRAGLIRELDDTLARPDPPVSVLRERAELYARDHDYAAAAKLYEQATIRNFGDVSMRLQYCKCLLSMGRKEDAVNEAKIVLRLNPNDPRAAEIISTATATSRPVLPTFPPRNGSSPVTPPAPTSTQPATVPAPTPYVLPPSSLDAQQQKPQQESPPPTQGVYLPVPPIQR